MNPTRPGLLACLAVLSVAAPAAAQDFTVTLVNPNFTSFSGLDCSDATISADPVEFSWTAPLIAGQTEDVFLSKKSDCADEDASRLFSFIDEGTERTAQTGTVERGDALTVAELFNEVTGAGCGPEGGLAATDVFLCVAITTPGAVPGSTAARDFKAIKLTLDSQPPPVPTGLRVDALDGGLRLSWTMPSDVGDTAGYNMYVQAPGGAERKVAVSGPNLREATIDDLENGVVYTATVTSFDSAGSSARASTFRNESARSAPQTGSPQPVEDFFQRYRRLGGKETGGCASAGWSAVALLGLLPLALRRRRAAAAVRAGGAARAVAAALVCATCLPAAAQPPRAGDDLGGWAPIERLRSPRHFYFEFRTGPWMPDPDQEFGKGGPTPFKDIFGTEASWLSRLEIDYSPFDKLLGRDLGFLGVGLSAGYWQTSGRGRRQDDSQALDEINFTVWPLTPLLVYRADFINHRWGVPLVPHAKLGYGFANWTCARAAGDRTCRTADAEGDGWARGLEYSLGLTLVLDMFEPDKAASLDLDYGINSTGLFVEWTGMEWEGAHGLRLDGSQWQGGLSLAF